MPKKSKTQNPKSKIGQPLAAISMGSTSGYKLKILSVSFFLFLVLFSRDVFAQTFESGYYRLTTQWQGEGKALDVINDGANNKLQLAATGNFSGQFWKITAVGDGYFRLTTQWLGEAKALDVVNDGVNNKLHLAETKNVSGQFWKITSLGNGYYRLTTKWLGDGKSLDVINDGANNKLQLAATGDFSGQFWKIEKVSANPKTADSALETTKNSKQMFLSGFKIMVNPDLAEKAETKEALKILSEKLEELTKIIKAKHLERLRKVPVWIQYKLKSDSAMWYHTSKDWLVSNGYPAELENSVEINNLRNFIAWQDDQPFMVLHEFAHAQEDLYLPPEMQDKITAAYEKALAGGKYNNVQNIRGATQRHYAMNNKTEYFAELTEAYFGKNDYYPFNKKQLEEFDPTGYKLMQEAWE